MHLQYKIVQTGVIGKRIVIFAIYPGTTSIFSIKRALDSFEKTNFSTLVVINNHIGVNNFLDLLSDYNCTVILRPNIGRDIGAYQCGIRFLGGKSLELSFEKIALINDTLYVTKNSSDFYETFLMSPHVNCIYMNNQDIHHASSHSLVLDEKVLASRNLINFWKKYYPSSSRLHSIYKGEFGLTETLGESYFKPIINHNLFHDLSKENHLNDLEKSQIRIWSKKSRMNSNELLETYFDNNQDKEALHYCLDNFQVSNSLGLYLYRAFKVPIKLDICKHGLVSAYSFMDLLKPDMELDEITDLWSNLKPVTANKSSPVQHAISVMINRLKQFD
jgi:hypothetical protein